MNTRFKIRFTIILILLLSLSISTASSSAQNPVQTLVGTTEQVSVFGKETQGNNWSTSSYFSADGVYEPYSSVANILAHAGIPLENLQPSNLTGIPSAPLAEGDYQWHTFYGSTDDDDGFDITIDNNGGIYIVGCSSRSWLGPEGQAPLHAFSKYFDIVVLKLDAQGSYQWHTFYGSTSFDSGYGIAVDDNGGVYISGYSSGSWSGPAGQAPLHPFSGSLGSWDITIIKLNTAGSYQWHTFYGSISRDIGLGITMDGSDGVYITGYSDSSWNGSAGQIPLHVHSGSNDIVILKLNAAGTYQWHTFYGSTGDDCGEGLAVESNSGIYMVGFSITSWNGSTGQAPLHTHSGNNDIVILKLDTAGTYQWHTFYGSVGEDIGGGIAVDSGGGVYITGYSYDSWDGPAGQAPLHIYSGDSDITVLKLNTTGGYQWHTFYGSTGIDIASSIVMNNNCGLYITSWSESSWNGPLGQAPLHTHSIYPDLAVLKLNTLGNYLWHTFYGPAGTAMGGGTESIVVNDTCGMFISDTGAVSWNGPAGQPPLHAFTMYNDILVLKLQDYSKDIGFRPNPDGYSFSNTDLKGAYDSDYTISDMRRMFGDDAVCKTVNPDCKVRWQAKLWRIYANIILSRGHCDGMASTSLRFFRNQDTHPGLDHTYMLGPPDNVQITWQGDIFNTTVRRNISFFLVDQLVPPIRKYKDSISQKNTPQQILEQLALAMSNGAPDPTTLFIRQADQGGHSITPYAISNEGNGIYWIWVYDNNHPYDYGNPGDSSRYVVVNTSTDSWSYDLGGFTWSGNAGTHTLGIVPISIYAQRPCCSWCECEVAGIGQAEVWLTGGGHLLISDSQGRRLGYLGSEYISEIPGAYGGIIDAGIGIELEPIYTLPLTETYTILLDGQTLTQTASTAFAQFGPGYAVSIDNVTVSPTTQDQLFIANSGNQLAYHAIQDQEPSLSLAVDSLSANYGLEIQGADIAASDTITITADTTAGDLTLNGSQLSGGAYNLNIRMVNSGGVVNFYHSDVPLLATDTHIINFGPWDGSGTITLEIDHGSDGTIDETVDLENQMQFVFLPVVGLH